MTPDAADDYPYEDWTPEEKKKIYAEMQKKFTPEMLIEYIEDDVPKVPAEQVLAELEQIVRRAEESGQQRAV